MPDVERSDSQRSDASLRPRVSFNRDVHVKRIGPRGSAPGRVGPPSSSVETSTLQPPTIPIAPVRKQRLGKLSKDELVQEAARVVKQADSVKCTADNLPDKFFTLPVRKRHRKNDSPRLERRNSDETNLKSVNKPVARSRSDASSLRKTRKPARGSLFSIFRKSDKDLSSQTEKTNKKSNLSRSKSDASDSKVIKPIRKRTGSESEEYLTSVQGKKAQLSPIIEITSRDDYFTKNNEATVDEVDAAIDKPKSEDIANDNVPVESNITKYIKETIESLENSGKLNKTEDMIHSSQKPAEKLPLTKGNTVNQMVRILSNEKLSSPKTSLLINTAMHNNNKPFSYTQPSLSPNSNMYTPNSSFNQQGNNITTPHSPNPIIYAQVVCNNEGKPKQTIHTSFKPKNLSDEDEGLGFETHNKHNNHLQDRYVAEDPYKSLSDYNPDFDQPITPNLKNFRGERYEFNDSSFIERGRADGMDSRRRESLTEPVITIKTNNLSQRRDLLQSRINNRHVFGSGEKLSRHPHENENVTSKYITETSKYYRDGTGSPVGFTEKYQSETRMKDGVPYTTEYRTRNNFDGKRSIDERRELLDGAVRHFDDFIDNNEPKSFDSQLSDYRSSPEQKFNGHRVLSHDNLNSSSGRYIHSNKYKNGDKYAQNREHYQSNPEIVQRSDYLIKNQNETYHNSLRRQKVKNETNRHESSRRYDHYEERDRNKDRFADSGIENDYRKDSNGEISSRNNSKRNFKSSKGNLYNESEDEGFTSSLLIQSERQHTENNVTYNRDFDSDRDRRYNSHDRERDRDSYIPNDRDRGGRYPDDYRNLEHMDYKQQKRVEEYSHRERSIDDGSHYDPRIDKLDRKDVGTLKKKDSKLEKKPPKPEKKMSGLEKMRQLFSRDSTKKTKKEKEKILERSKTAEQMVRDEVLRARYSEYKGSSENLDDVPDRRARDNLKGYRDSPKRDENFDYSNRRRLSTPSASPSPPRRGRNPPETKSTPRTSRKVVEAPTTENSWFKSLGRRSKNKTSVKKEDSFILTEDETSNLNQKHPSNLSSSNMSSGSRSRHAPSSVNTTPRNHSTSYEPNNSGPSKSLRFFGDTDMESNPSISKHKSNLKTRPIITKHTTLTRSVQNGERGERIQNGDRSNQDGRQTLLLNSYNKEKFSNGRRNLHNISEIQSQSETESQYEEERKREYRYNDRSRSNSREMDRLDKKPPMSPLKDNRKSKIGKAQTLTRGSRSELRKSKTDIRDDSRERSDTHRRRHDVNGGHSGESSTEGDSSQQSQRSVVYLHAATVGDIPGPNKPRARRAASREELSSIASSKLQPQMKTVSRSISVLAPWKPRHYREGYDINYSQTQNQTLRPSPKSKTPNSSLISNDTNSKRPSRNGKLENSTLSRRSKEIDEKKQSNGTLYRKNKDRSSKENISERRNKENVNLKSKSGTLGRPKIEKSRKSGSVEALSRRDNERNENEKREKISRSMSMPKDQNKSAGWFKLNKKTKK